MPIPGMERVNGNALAKVTPLLSTLPPRSTLTVYHDDWCAYHDGEECNCDPAVDIRPWQAHAQPKENTMPKVTKSPLDLPASPPSDNRGGPGTYNGCPGYPARTPSPNAVPEKTYEEQKK